MMINGKILFFNESEGKGIIINSNKEKISFEVQNWNDFELMPSLGLEVVFNLDGDTALNIISKSTKEAEGFEEDQEVVEDIKKENITDEILDIIQSQEGPVEESKNSIVEELTQPDTMTEDSIIEKISKESEEDVQERPQSITITINISTAVKNYFEMVNSHIGHRKIYKKVDGRLDYLLTKRFLFTTFNNLTDIDLHIITPKIKMLHDDLRLMSRVYDDFAEKIKYPNLAYQEVFLSCQAEYMKIKNGAEYTIERLKQLRGDEEQLDDILKIKKEEFDEDIKSAEFDALQNELKSLSGTYVDVVHMMAELDERYRSDIQLLNTFEEEYKAEFSEIFGVEALFHKKNLIEILNAQAYLLDSQLWQQAKKSRAVKAHFKDSSIIGEFNTKTYLKYYLESLDSDKATTETKKLFALYEYLLSVQKDYVMIVVNSSQDAMEYESSIKNLKTTYEIKSFIDEKSAIKWGIKNSVKILVLEDQLKTVNAEKFLHIYKKHVTLTPKIILLGEKPRINSYSISCLLPKNASTKIITDSIKSIVNSK